MKLNYLILSIISPSYYKSISESIKNQNINHKELNSLQQKKLINLLLHSKNNVPYYEKLLQSIEVNNINHFTYIPFLSNEIIRDNYDKLKAINLNQRRFKYNSTSGSTGQALKFYSDRNGNHYRHACTIRGDSWTGWRYGEAKLILWGAIKDTNKSQTIKGRIIYSKLLFNTTMLSSFNMTNNDMIKYIDIINKNKPTLIIGYPSSLELFSQFIKKENLSIHTPKGLITGGETLYNNQRNIIQEVFHSKVLNRYGSRDVGHVANECELQNGLHISSDRVYVELINENGGKCEPGEIGEIVVTDLDNYVFPFIRYKTGDLGVYTDRICPCGKPFPLLESVVGRTFDLIIGTNGNRVSGNYFSLSLKYSIKGIESFQVVQNKINTVNLNLKVNSEYNIKEEYKLIKLLKKKLGKEMNIIIEKVDNIQNTASGKHRWVISKVSPFVI